MDSRKRNNEVKVWVNVNGDDHGTRELENTEEKEKRNMKKAIIEGERRYGE